MGMGDNGFNNPFLDFLEDRPEAGFFSFQDQFGRAPAQRQFFQRQFGDIQNEFLGLLGEQIRGGDVPNLRFLDFLEDFDFSKRFRQLPPSQRGGTAGFQRLFSPRTRSLFF